MDPGRFILTAIFATIAPSLLGETNTGARALLENGNRQMNENRFTEAAGAFRAAAAAAKSAGDGIAAGTSLDHLGVAYTMLSRDRDAELCFQQASALLESGGVNANPSLAMTWMDWASLYMNAGRYPRARELAQRALEADRTMYGDSTKTAAVLSVLGEIARRMHRPADAEHYCREALAMLEHCGRSHSSEWFLAVNNLAVVLITTGRLQEGREYLSNAVSSGEAVFLTPPYKLVLAALSTNLARIDVSLKNFDEAGENLRRALTIFETYFGPDDPALADTLSAYAALCRVTKRKSEAKEYERRAKECRKAAVAAPLANTVDLRELALRPR